MIIIITGNLGYIGTILTQYLHSEGYEVWGIDCGYYDNCFLDTPLITTFGVDRQIYKDIRDVTINDLQGASALIHLAALSNDALGLLHPELTLQINTHASVKIAELAKRVGVSRFIFSSSCSVYGQADDELVSETTQPKPISVYAKSKLFTEMEVAKLADENFSPLFLRNATVYGYSPRMRFDLVLNNLIAWGYTTNVIRLLSKGESWRPLIHIEDVCKAILACLKSPISKISNQCINIGQNIENYQIIEIASQINKQLPQCQLEISAGAVADQRSYKVSFDKAKKILPMFQPSWTIHMGINQLIEVFNKINFNNNLFENKKFHRVLYLKYLLEKGAIDDNFCWQITYPGE